MNNLEEKKYDASVIIDYIQKATEKIKDINSLAIKYSNVLLTLEMAEISPEVAFNYIIINLDRMKGVSDFLDE